MDPSLRTGKQVIKPLRTSALSHVSIESKSQIHVKPRVGQGRAGIKGKILQTFPIHQVHDKPGTAKIIAKEKTKVKPTLNRNSTRSCKEFS